MVGAAIARWYVAVAAVVAVFSAGCGGDDVVDRPRTTAVPAETVTDTNLADWATDFCAVLEEFESTVTQSTPSAELAFEERKPQAIANFERYVVALDRAVEGFAAIDPPATAAAYHDASVAQFEAIRESYEVALPPLRDAETAEEIEAVNEGLMVAREAAGQAFESRVVLVAPAVATELSTHADCGGLTE